MQKLASPMIVLSLLIGCSSSTSEPEASPADDTGSVLDAIEEVAIDTAIAETAAEVAVDAPDFSMVNPIEGAATVAKITGKTFSFTEGTTWNADGYLLFSDIPNAKIWKLVPPSTF